MPRLIAHVDMNSFFASVEQQANPFLRGRPLGVCAYLHRHGCVIAASIEAKERGMKVGMTMEEAQAKVPNAVFVQNDPGKYRAVTSRVFSILHELTDTVEHYSIDEAFLDLTGWYRDPAEAAWALTRARRRITDEVGEWLRCSIGIAPTRFLAKLGSDIQKPSGLTIITTENLDEILARLDLEDVCGIGPRLRRRIEKLGYRSLVELRRAPIPNLIQAFGKNGYFLWAKLNGLEVERVASLEPPPKSIGHSYCVPNSVNPAPWSRITSQRAQRSPASTLLDKSNIRNNPWCGVSREGRVEAVLTKLAERAARRLRSHGLLAGVVSVSVGVESLPRVSEANRGGFGSGGLGGSDPSASLGTRFIRLDEPADDSFTLTGAATRLLYDMWDGKAPVNFLAVTFTELAPPSGQARMGFAQQASHDRVRRLSAAADLARDKHGDEALVLGRMFRVSARDALDRIGFRKTNGISVEGAWDGVNRRM